MKCAALIPVGPGHWALAQTARESVLTAWAYAKGPFDALQVKLFDDTAGEAGRSKARNALMDGTPADFHFLLDADDRMMQWAFGMVDVAAAATFGAVCLSGRRYHANVWPCSRETLLKRGARGTLSMGCFVRGNLGMRFDESMDVAEDFDFYMRLPGFTKRQEALVSIGYDKPSAGGPRGYERIRWVEACNEIIERYRPS